MKKFIIGFLSLVTVCVSAQEAEKLSLFKLQDVQLLPGVFYDAQNTDLAYIMAMDPNRLLAPYLREAGLEPKATPYTNWENTGLDGHIGGHYVSALSLMYASTGDKKVLERLNYMLKELKMCQDKIGTGYLGGVPGSKELWEEVQQGKLDVGGFSVNKKWVPLYNIHKMYAGLRDAYLYAGIGQAKEMLIRYCDWMIHVTAKLSDDQMQYLLQSEHGGLNEVFADVADITADKKYMNLAYRFSHQFILTPLSKKEDKLNNLHANTQIPKVIGFERIAELTGDTAYRTSAHFFWETVVNNRTIAIGGNSVREHFHPMDNFSTMITSEQGPETCNTYNMLRLTKMLYCTGGEEKYIDYYERALYNHILSSQHPAKGGFVYFTPMRPGHYRVYSKPQTSMWCCVGSGIENHAKYGELIYAYSNSGLYVNLFVSSKLNWKEKGVVISQQTKFPDEEKTSLKIEEAKNSDFTLHVRHPKWISGNLTITVNGQPVKVTSVSGEYAAINRNWKKGDRIEVSLPMKTTTEEIPDHSGYFAVLHGPVVLAAKTDTSNLTGLFADDSRMGHVAQGKQYPLQEMPVFVSDNADITSFIHPVKGSNMTFSAKGLIYPSKFEGLQLIPFFRLHDARYMIYWQLVTPDKLKQMQEELAAKEAENQKIAANTIDVVFAGEQQPESDHFIESENSATGVFRDKHWRSAKGWFSYKMRDSEKKALKIQISYFGAGSDQGFILELNRTEIGRVELSELIDEIITKVFDIPAEIVKDADGKLSVRFNAIEGKTVSRITEVRLLKE